MKVALINNDHPPYRQGAGTEAVVDELASMWRAHGHEVTVICLRPYDAAPADPDGLKSFTSHWRMAIGARGLAGFLRRAVVWLRPGVARSVVSYLTKNGFEAVITNNVLGFGTFLPVFLRRTGIRHVHYLHDVQLFYSSGLMMLGSEGVVDRPWWRIYTVLNRMAWGSPDLVVSPSSWLAAEHRRRGFFRSSDIAIWPQPVSRSFRPARPDKARDGTFTFLFAGQIEPHKGVEMLLAAYHRLLADKGGEKMRLTVIGEGGERQRLADKYRHPSISWSGFLSGQDYLAAFRQADVLVVPSLCYENSPMAIREAEAAGVPVIGADLGGISELLAGGRGRLFRPGDTEALLEAMIDAVEGRLDPNRSGPADPGDEAGRAEEYWRLWEGVISRTGADRRPSP